VDSPAHNEEADGARRALDDDLPGARRFLFALADALDATVSLAAARRGASKKVDLRQSRNGALTPFSRGG